MLHPLRAAPVWQLYWATYRDFGFWRESIFWIADQHHTIVESRDSPIADHLSARVTRQLSRTVNFRVQQTVRTTPLDPASVKDWCGGIQVNRLLDAWASPEGQNTQAGSASCNRQRVTGRPSRGKAGK